GSSVVTLPCWQAVDGRVARRKICLEKIDRNRVFIGRAEYVLHALAGVRGVCQRVDGFFRRIAKVSRSFGRGRQDGVIEEGSAGLAQTGIGAEEEGAVVNNGAAEGSAELIAVQGGLGQCR